MRNNTDRVAKTQKTYVIVTLVFLVLAISLQVILWFYWVRMLEPRLLREAESQASVLAHAQSVMLEESLAETDPDKRLRKLESTIDEILLFTEPETSIPFYLGLEVEIDYEVIHAPWGSLNLERGVKKCNECFLSEVPLFSPVNDELMGIAKFRVGDSVSRRLRNDVRRTLFAQSYLGTILLVAVWCVVMFLLREVNRSRRRAGISASGTSRRLSSSPLRTVYVRPRSM